MRLNSIGQNGRRRDEGVDARHIGIEHRPRVGVEGGVIGLRARAKAEAAHQEIVLQPRPPGDFRPAAERAAAVVLHLPQAILRVDIPLREKYVMH